MSLHPTVKLRTYRRKCKDQRVNKQVNGKNGQKYKKFPQKGLKISRSDNLSYLFVLFVQCFEPFAMQSQPGRTKVFPTSAPNCQYEHFSTAPNTPPLNSSTPKVYSQLLFWRGCPPAAKTSVFHSRFVPTGRMLLKANLIVRLRDQLAPPGDCTLYLS